MNRPATTVYIATSLDGFIARSDGAIDWLGEPDPENDYGWSDFFPTIDAIVMGRVTFEQVLTFGQWFYEETPLIVLSQTLTDVPEHLSGKAEVSSLSPVALLEHLAERGARRVYIDGGRTIQSFLRSGLIDEMVITTIPVLIGDGIRLFGSLDADITWEHISTTTFDTGLVKSHYRVVGTSAKSS